jgi:hypothetical protein
MALARNRVFMQIELEGRAYELVFGSDVQRDGVYLELSDISRRDPVVVLDAFHWDADGRITLSAYREDLPLVLVEWFVAEARRRLPPSPDTPDLAAGTPPSRPAG